jgi:hypothetical protein
MHAHELHVHCAKMCSKWMGQDIWSNRTFLRCSQFLAGKASTKVLNSDYHARSIDAERGAAIRVLKQNY